MEILLGFEMEKTGENLEYWTENFTQILDHILIRDTDNEIYWASPPPPPLPPPLYSQKCQKKNTFPTSIIYVHLCKADNWFCPFVLCIKEVWL